MNRIFFATIIIGLGTSVLVAKLHREAGKERIVEAEVAESIEGVPGSTVVDPTHQLINSIEKEILQSDFGPDSSCKEAVFRAIVFEFARLNKFEAIQKMKAAEQDLSFLNSEKDSLLHVAAENGFIELIQLLVDDGLDVDQQNQSGRTPLFLAATHNQMNCIRLLLNTGADPNGGSTNQVPLNTAAWYGHAPVVQILLKAGAENDRQDADGNTPLHKSVWQGNLECVELLLNDGADPEATNQVGLTPRQLAAMRMEKSRNDNPKRAWGPEHVLGEPDAGDGYSQLEWCPSTTGQKEWLELSFANEVIPRQFEVYAKPAPNIVERITVFDQNGDEHEVWKGTATPAKDRSPHIAELSVDTEIKTKRVKVYVDGTRNNTWVYFDAFGIVDKDGDCQWATRAKSSTTYATGPEPIDKHELVAELLGSEKRDQ